MNTYTHSSLARTTLALCAGFLLLAGPLVSPAAAAPATVDHADSQEIDAQDVYVIVISTLRHPTVDTDPAAPLFNEAGSALGLSWGQWQTASATASARFKNGRHKPHTEVNLQLTGLVPGGVYSIFWGTLNPDSENPLCPHVERTLPLMAVNAARQRPDASSFVADRRGRAQFNGRVEGDLLAAMQVFYTIVYHSDGQTYGSLPNRGEFLTQGSNCRSSFGQDAMRQLIIFQKS